MIKEWCDECNGKGEITYGIIKAPDDCKVCQGKGWTPLEADFIGTEKEMAKYEIDSFADCTSDRKIEVYIVECKE